jgi:hypothetical protein
MAVETATPELRVRMQANAVAGVRNRLRRDVVNCLLRPFESPFPFATLK